MEIKTLTKENFDAEVLHSAGPVLVEFWAPWCGYCRRAAPMIDALAAKADFPAAIGKVNVDEQPELEDRFAVELIPTLLVFRGGKFGERLIAPSSAAQIEAFVASELA
jgi:thioredoxin 1